jgi:uncharacterized protein (DUF697 family)
MNLGIIVTVCGGTIASAMTQGILTAYGKVEEAKTVDLITRCMIYVSAGTIFIEALKMLLRFKV